MEVRRTAAADGMGVNRAPSGFEADLAPGFLDFLLPLHRALGPRRDALVARRAAALAAAHAGAPPAHRPPSEATEGDWRVELPAWCIDQRNQMTGPADDAELVVKMLNSGAPGVMLDLEDSMANAWPNLVRGLANVRAALHGELTYEDRKRGATVGVRPSATVVFTRPRGLHIGQYGIFEGEVVAASLFDAAAVAFSADLDRLAHPLAFYVPKSESAEEAVWWRDLFRALAEARGLAPDAIKCMALVESHPLAFEIEEFLYELRDHALGLNLGRWDYMASLAHFNLHDPAWVLPDRNTIPHDVAFFQNLRELLPEICHKRGALAIGGMTALFPSREDAALNERALAVLAEDKRNEARSLMDGAWTGHPDQNGIAVAQFPAPNQAGARRPGAERYPDLRPVPAGVGERTVRGTRAAVRTVIRYRQGVLAGKGASLLDGYMEDLATDRIYRLMIAQRVRHRDAVAVLGEDGEPVSHTPAFVSALFDEELERILRELPAGADASLAESFRLARAIGESLVARGEFDPQ